ncbi:MAG: 2-oxoglutarate dehydrogenase E1 component [bacterium]|nr:2-oxoglutarate dehydrogenase E1 component [bacterium]
MSSDNIPLKFTSSDSLLASANLIDENYRQWLANRDSVSVSWNAFFSGYELARTEVPGDDGEHAGLQSRVAGLIYSYRSVGHLIADINPLSAPEEDHPDLQLELFGLGPEHLDQVFDPGSLHGTEKGTLCEIIEALRETYCRSVAAEYVHIQDRSIRVWLQEEMESHRNRPTLTREQKLAILEQLIDAELFETFLHSRYQGQKRFSLEGAESTIPALRAFLEAAGAEGCDEVVVGMAHRGRLNVLANILHKPYNVIFHEFEDNLAPDRVGGDGDVKYHRGFSSLCSTSDGKTILVSLTANPSHLEAVDPVVEGRTRAKQRRRGDTKERRRVIPLLIHGDAAFAGQGLVAETFNLSQLKGYETGGTIHFIINNQIGFTTSPGDARSSRYSTDVAKLVEAPIFHVNGDDPEAVCYVMDLALRFRQRFRRDVVVDMICYRRHGHNEGDEPAFTQPVMYSKIRFRPTARQIYQGQLQDAHELNVDDSVRLENEFRDRLQDAFREAKESCPLPAQESGGFRGVWADLDSPFTHQAAKTSVHKDSLTRVAHALTTVPEDFILNRKVARRLPERLKVVEDGASVDWALAELLAFGTLLDEGIPVRLSGQDSMRGTFSHRHAAWFDSKSGEIHVPLLHIREGQAPFCVYNSMLSEAAVLGFDYGYSLVEPHMLVIWEAQFGDFANGAQVIIDQFISASLDKWERSSGLVMLLPHGYEGQGPEHSNAYLERYLTLCAEENMQVCNLTTPAQYFHALRRQIKRPFRRPLVIMAPKSLLRHKYVSSPFEDLTSGAFHEILDDLDAPKRANRLILCSGKVYYDLIEARAHDRVSDAAIVRIEQLYPLHEERLAEIAEKYADIEHLIWVQEETQNRGAWSYILPRLLDIFQGKMPRYVGREPSASPATASPRIHREQQEELVTTALTG